MQLGVQYILFHGVTMPNIFNLDLERGASTHKFKSSSFKIATNCDFCHERIWGLGNKGLNCKDCGYACHSKCEMKVPATCPGVLDKSAKKALKEEKRAQATLDVGNGDGYKSSEISRSNTMTSTLSATHSAEGGGTLSPTKSISTRPSVTAPSPARARVLAPPPMKYIAPPPESIAELPTDDNLIKGRMIYAYNAVGEGEISVAEGRDVFIVEPDGIYLKCLSLRKING